MNKEEVMKLAREAGLIRTGDGWTEPYRWGMTEIERFAALVAAHKTETALAEAYRCGFEAGVIEERESEQEPRNIRERWNIELDGDDLLVCFNDHEKSEGCRYERYVPATTAPPQRKPLTDEELEVLWDDATDRMEHFCSQYWDFARAIEAAHGIGEKHE